MQYTLDLVTIEQVQGELNGVLSGLTSDQSLRKQAEAAGIDLAQLDQALKASNREKLIQIQQRGAGLDPVTTAIVVAFAPVAAKIARDIWDNLVVPRIRRNHGADSIKPIPHSERAQS